MADDYGSQLGQMWRSVYQQARQIATEEINKILGNIVRGGKVLPGAIAAGPPGTVLTSPAGGGGTSWTAPGGGSGTVTSVGLTAPAELVVGGSPITGAGTLAITKAVQVANTVWAGPLSATAPPTFRLLVAGDIPALDAGAIATGTFAAGRLPLATTAAFGAVKPDGTTITIAAGVITSVGGGTTTSILGGDGLVPSAYLATPPGTVAELGRWTRGAHNPILAATAAWESTGVSEPNWIIAGGQHRLYYSGGWSSDALGVATCPLGAEPALPGNWTKMSGPILGLGGGGYSGPVWHQSVVLLHGTFYCYFSDAGAGNILVSSSADGLTGWSTPATALAGTVGTNTDVFEDSPGHYTMLVEDSGSGTWHLTRATATSPLGPFTRGATLSGLQVVSGGTVSGPWLPKPAPKIDGNFQLYYHTSTTAGAVFPCSFYRATSADLATWTIAGKVLDPLLGYPESDAVGDACVAEYDGRTYLAYTGVHESASSDTICIAVFNGTLHQLVAGAPLPGEPNGPATLGADGILAVAQRPAAGGPGTHYEPVVLDNPGGTAPIFVVNDNGQVIMIEVAN